MSIFYLYLIVSLVSVAIVTYLVYIDGNTRGNWILGLIFSIIPLINLYIIFLGFMEFMEYFKLKDKLDAWLEKPAFNKEKHK